MEILQQIANRPIVTEDNIHSQHSTQAPSAPTSNHPPNPSPLPEKEIFISYAWGGESENIANQIDQAFQDQDITLIRDKRDLGFKGRINLKYKYTPRMSLSAIDSGLSNNP